MSSDDTSIDDRTEESTPAEELSERLEEGTDRAIEEFDQRLVDLLAWLLDTETKARIYVYLRQQPQSTSEEIAEGTGLYPSTVREALAEMTDDEAVKRNKRDSTGAGNNPYEYDAVAPSELVSSAAEQVQDQLNAVFNLDSYLQGSSTADIDSDPVTISVEEPSDSQQSSTDDHSDSDS